jgi:hypothetical protein
MNALQHTNHCGTQSYLIKDFPALKEIATKIFGNRENNYQLLTGNIFNFKLEQPGRYLNFCHVANYLAK